MHDHVDATLCIGKHRGLQSSKPKLAGQGILCNTAQPICDLQKQYLHAQQSASLRRLMVLQLETAICILAIYLDELFVVGLETEELGGRQGDSGSWSI